MASKTSHRRVAVLALAVAAGFALVSGRSASAQDLEARNTAIVREALKAWGEGRPGGPYDLLADDAVWTITGRSDASRVYASKADFIDNVIRPFGARMSKGLTPTVKALYADGDTVVAHFDAEGVAKDGLPYRNTYAWFLTLKDGRIVRATAFYDAIAFNELWRRVAP